MLSHMQPGLTYVLRNAVYVALTNRAACVTLIESRGPSFEMPASSGFAVLPDGFEPSAAQAISAIEVRAREGCSQTTSDNSADYYCKPT